MQVRLRQQRLLLYKNLMQLSQLRLDKYYAGVDQVACQINGAILASASCVLLSGSGHA